MQLQTDVFLPTAEAPRISSDPQECEEVIPGEETNMTIKATGTEPLQYSWMYRPLDAIERGINVWALAGGDGVQGADTQDIRGERYNTTQATRCFHSTHGLDIGAQVTKQLV